MNKRLFSLQPNDSLGRFWLAGLLILGLTLMTWALPAWFTSNEAIAQNVDPKFEAQVLQVLREHPEIILESVNTYQQKQQQQRQAEVAAFLQTLKANPAAAIGQSPLLGAAEPEVFLLEFSDFQCPYCARSREALEQFIEQHPEAALVYKQFPLTAIHPQALPAAKAAWAAAQQGKFWPYHDGLFQQQDDLGEELYLSLAEELDLDLEQFNRDRTSKTATLAIQADMEMASQLEVPGTPFLVMNGNVFQDRIELSNLESFLAAIQKDDA